MGQMSRQNRSQSLRTDKKGELEHEVFERKETLKERVAIDDNLFFNLKPERQPSLRAQRTRMTGTFLNTMMGDSLMAGENDDFVDELSDEDLFKDDDDKLRG